MKKPLRHKLPRVLGKLLRRLVVRLVGLAVSVIGDLLDIAIGNGLDLERVWPKELKNVAWPWSNQPALTGRGAKPGPDVERGGRFRWGVRDFFLLEQVLGGRGAEVLLGEPPRCSIIIPVFNHVEYTFRCLWSLLRELDLSQHEIIIVNNASRDETARLLSSLGSFVSVIDNSANMGFVKACNQGAAAARGEYLVFLNNDTVVESGWLDGLVETAENDASVGAVGSMFVYPDGRLQEAGAIIWRDGTGWGYGKGEDPLDKRFGYARDVDYCSGASLLVRKELFDRLGGFDERYAPAYYEDVDLCFGIRSLGYRVIYQPSSRLVHEEGGTSGTDIGRGFKRYQKLNRSKFVEKWHGDLHAHFEADPGRVDAAADRRRGPRCVVFDEMFTSPRHDAGSLRMMMILKSLAKWGRPVFVSIASQLSPEAESLLARVGVEVAHLPDHRNHQLSYQDFLKEGGFDAAILSRPALADALFPVIRKCRREIKIIYDTVDIHFLRLEREYQLTGDERAAQEARLHREQEIRLAGLSDQVWCVSADDTEVLTREAGGASVKIIPTIHALNGRGKDFGEREGLLFIGNFNHRPNKDGVSYFVNEVWPFIRKSLPGVRFHIVGSNMPVEIMASESDDIVVEGYVPDVQPLFQSCRVSVAPLRYGAGLKGKVGQALSYGLPTVTTSIGAEGMGLRHRHNAMVADDPEEFARAVVELYRCRELWQLISDNGYDLIRRHFAPEVVEAKVLAAMRELGGIVNEGTRLDSRNVTPVG